MAKKSKNNNNLKPLAGFTGKTIDLTKFNLKTDKEQYEIIKESILSRLDYLLYEQQYPDANVEIYHDILPTIIEYVDTHDFIV